jgi:hypothetical protein
LAAENILQIHDDLEIELKKQYNAKKKVHINYHALPGVKKSEKFIFRLVSKNFSHRNRKNAARNSELKILVQFLEHIFKKCALLI